jgi:hypothetical protein
VGSPVTYVLEESPEHRIYIYQHSDGYLAEERLRSAISYSRSQWRDPSYMNRMLLDHIIQSHDGKTGYGISCEFQDSMYPVLVVDHQRKGVYIEGKPEHCVPFDDYVSYGR